MAKIYPSAQVKPPRPRKGLAGIAQPKSSVPAVPTTPKRKGLAGIAKPVREARSTYAGPRGAAPATVAKGLEEGRQRRLERISGRRK